MNRFLTMGVTLACAIMLCSSCTMTTKAADFNGLSTPDGKAISHTSTSNIALNFLVVQPIAGDASLEKTLADFTQAAKEQNAKKVAIVQSNSCKWWFILFPLTCVLTPVTSNVAGDVLP